METVSPFKRESYFHLFSFFHFLSLFLYFRGACEEIKVVESDRQLSRMDETKTPKDVKRGGKTTLLLQHSALIDYLCIRFITHG